MKLRLYRHLYGTDYTVGTLYVNGERFCDTLEDTVRNLDKETKVYGETAIPFGTYDVICRESPKFKRVLPLLLNVPHFEGVLIHRGNTATDTAGCILVGEYTGRNGVIKNSTCYEIRLTDKILSALERGEDVTIEIE